MALLFLAGAAGGFVNVLAGGGSLVTLPALMALGLPADLANATNRLAICAQSGASAVAFDRSGRLDRKAIVGVVAPTLVGALGGSLAASYLSAAVLRPVLIGSLLVVAVLLVARPSALSSVAFSSGEARPAPGPLQVLWLTLIGAYGGFVQVGVGLFLLAYLCGRLRYDLVSGNALKVVAVGAFTVLSLAVFVLRGQVVWLPGLLLAAGTVVGALGAVRFSLAAHERVLRWVVFAAVLFACAAAILR